MLNKFPKPLIFIIIFSLLVLFSIFNLFVVKNITILENDACVNKEDLVKASGVLGKSTFLINTKELSKKLSLKFSCIEKSEIKIKFPSTVEISYSGMEAVARVNSSDLILTSEGLAIAASIPTSNLPVFFLPQGIVVNPGERISDPNIILALNLTGQLLKSDFVPTNVRIVNDSITVYNGQESVVIFSTKKKAENQSDSLQKVLAKVKMEPKKITKIDMRFDDPIIVFEQN